jgi:hypothetical protein
MSRCSALTPIHPSPADGTRLSGDGFEIETLINIRIARAGLKVDEVASYEHPRIHGVSNLNAWTDGWRVLRTILVERFYYSRKRKLPARSLRSQAYRTDAQRASWRAAHSYLACPAAMSLRAVL